MLHQRLFASLYLFFCVCCAPAECLPHKWHVRTFGKIGQKKRQKPAGCRSRIISKNRPVPIFGRSTGASLINTDTDIDNNQSERNTDTERGLLTHRENNQSERTIDAQREQPITENYRHTERGLLTHRERTTDTQRELLTHRENNQSERTTDAHREDYWHTERGLLTHRENNQSERTTDKQHLCLKTLFLNLSLSSEFCSEQCLKCCITSTSCVCFSL